MELLRAMSAFALHKDIETIHAGHHSAVMHHNVAQVHSFLTPERSDMKPGRPPRVGLRVFEGPVVDHAFCPPGPSDSLPRRAGKSV